MWIHRFFQIQAVVDDVLDSSSTRSEKLNQEISEMHSLSGDAEEKWQTFIDRTESNYVEDSAAVEAGRCTLAEGLEFWYMWQNHISLSLTMQMCNNFDACNSM